MRSFINRRVAIAIVALSLLLTSGLSALSQRNSAANKELPLKQLLQLPGKLVSEAKSARPNGDLRLTGYRVEEVSLPQNVNVEIRGQQVSVDKAWRVSVQGGPFPVRALPAVIWIDDQIVGNGIENETLSQVTAITFDSSLIREGGVVSVSYGEDKETRRKFPQALQLKQGGGN
ncbi:MAG TPA: hypothetical protein VJ306_06795 [Pyrinomonadaceae bacterium]|nr:hypothetical protein [Pyrinomonadaceae bacterium]